MPIDTPNIYIQKMIEEDSFQDESDDDSISLLFNNVNNLTLEDTDYIDDNNAAITQIATHHFQSQQQRKNKDNKRQKNRKAKKKKHKQHSLEYLKQKVTHLMSIFEKNGWYIPLPNSQAESVVETSIVKGEREGKDSTNTNNNKINIKKQSKGKVWSNRNYGQDKKRQRKESERRMIERRIIQLECILQNEHGMVDLSLVV